MSFANNCYKCRSKLIPIIYGRVDDKYLDLEKTSTVVLGGIFQKPYNSFCPLCEESYADYTEMPS
jgi:hypothetical protein